jgi:LmbE family N-acetylglucosaminyl deacetylase
MTDIGRAHPFPFRTVLGVWAHPDDEAYLSAGLMATAVDAGARVVVATATRGESGTDDPEALSPERLAALREAELTDSLGLLGVSEHRWLRGRSPLVDGCLSAVSREEGVGTIAGLLTDVRPDLVVTFGPDGLTGHTDHRTISGWVTTAWDRTGRRSRLWYAALTREFVDRWGELCTEVGVWMDGGPAEPVDERDTVHLQTCAGTTLDRKFAALRAHTTQTAGLIDRVGEHCYRQWWRTEAFVDAESFAGIAGSEAVA